MGALGAGERKARALGWQFMYEDQKARTHFCSWQFPECLVVFLQLLSHVWLFATPWTAARQAELLRKRHLQASFIQLGHILHHTHLFISLPVLGSFTRSCIFKIRMGKRGQHLNFILGEQCKWSWQSLGLKKFQRDYPVGSVVKNSPCNAEDVGSVPGQGSRIPPPWRNWPTHHN